MNLMVLRPGIRTLGYAGFVSGHSMSIAHGRLEDYRGIGEDNEASEWALHQAFTRCAEAAGGEAPNALAVRAPFGGEEFSGPVLVTDDILERMNLLAPHAPLHQPGIVNLLRAARRIFPRLPIAVVFDTSFFTALPPREHRYAVDAQSLGCGDLRRFGYHGLYHEAACRFASARTDTAGPAQGPFRAISICLEPRPELAAVISGKPVMVTSGVTPLEGLPGERICGEIDPSIVLILSEKLGWGPEQINEALTRRSGVSGVAGRHVRLGRLLESSDPDLQFARDLLRYRILLACGMGVAAMGGLEKIVFSGRYAQSGRSLGPWLISRLGAARDPKAAPAPAWTCFSEPLDRIIADIAWAKITQSKSAAVA